MYLYEGVCTKPQCLSCVDKFRTQSEDISWRCFNVQISFFCVRTLIDLFFLCVCV